MISGSGVLKVFINVWILYTGTVAFVVHGGTIMSVMSNAFGGDYYDYSCINGSGYILECKFDENNLLHYSGYCGLDS